MSEHVESVKSNGTKRSLEDDVPVVKTKALKGDDSNTGNSHNDTNTKDTVDSSSVQEENSKDYVSGEQSDSRYELSETSNTNDDVRVTHVVRAAAPGVVVAGGENTNDYNSEENTNDVEGDDDDDDDEVDDGEEGDNDVEEYDEDDDDEVDEDGDDGEDDDEDDEEDDQ